MNALLPLTLSLLASPPADVGKTLWPDAAAIEQFLKEAKVTERKRIGRGITNPEKCRLELNGETRYAVFKKVEESYDSWRYEVAAYQLDKLLGVGHVPPTVERSLGGRKGCLQLWVEGTTVEKFTEKPADIDDYHGQVSVMWLFDDLIANIDRHMANAIITPDYGLAFIDNSKTFRQHKELLNDLNHGFTGTHARYWLVEYDANRKEYPTRYPPALLERLRAVTDKDIKKAVGPHVWGQMVDRLLERRQLILKRIDEMKGALSPSAGRAQRVPYRAEPSAHPSLGVGPQRSSAKGWGPTN